MFDSSIGGNLFLAVSGLSMAVAAFDIAASGVYDFHLAKKHHDLNTKSVKSKRLRQKLSVVVWLAEGLDGLEETADKLTSLDSVADVLVIAPPHFTKAQKAKLSRIKRKYKFHTVILRQVITIEGALHARRRRFKGRVVVTLAAAQAPTEEAFRRIVDYFRSDTQLSVLGLNLRASNRPTFGNLTWRIEDLIASRHRKARSLVKADINLPYAFRSRRPKKQDTAMYSSDVAVFSPWRTANAEFSIIKIVWLGAVAFLFAYFIYLAVAFQTTSFLAFSWALISGYLVLLIVTDDYLKLRQKTSLLAVAPIGYSFIYFYLGRYLTGQLKKLRQKSS